MEKSDNTEEKDVKPRRKNEAICENHHNETVKNATDAELNYNLNTQSDAFQLEIFGPTKTEETMDDEGNRSVMQFDKKVPLRF